MYSDSELLKIENVQMNKEGLAENERMKHAVIIILTNKLNRDLTTYIAGA